MSIRICVVCTVSPAMNTTGTPLCSHCRTPSVRMQRVHDAIERQGGVLPADLHYGLPNPRDFVLSMDELLKMSEEEASKTVTDVCSRLRAAYPPAVARSVRLYGEEYAIGEVAA